MEKKNIPRQKIFKILPQHTFLIVQEIQICDKIKISLTGGSAEIFGLELKKNYPHSYWIPCSLPVFTWEGAEVKVEWGQDESTKNAERGWVDVTNKQLQTPMIKYLQIFYQLSTLRKMCLEQIKEGPKVAIIGSEVSGLQNISKLLLNYSGKYNMNPMYVDLDPENSSIFVDGTIGVVPFQYKICEDLFDRPDKLCFYYGNRKVSRKSYLNMIKMLRETIKRKNGKQIKLYKQKGCEEEHPQFSSGLVIQCSRIRLNYDVNEQLSILQETLKTFDVSHLIIVDNKEAEVFFNKKVIQGLKIYKTKSLEGTQSFINLPRPIKSKIQRYFDKESKKKKYQIAEIKIFQIIESQQTPAYLREINIQQQAISKNTITILHAQIQQNLTKQEMAVKAMQSSICCLAYIYGIQSNNEEITLEVAHENFLQDFGKKIWLTSV